MILIILTLILCIIIFAITLYNQKFNFISIKLKNITERINSSLIKRKKLLEDSEQIIKSELNTKKAIYENLKDLNKEKQDMIKLDRKLLVYIKEFYLIKDKYKKLQHNNDFEKITFSICDNEEKLNAYKQYYNDTILEYNKIIKIFPFSILSIIKGRKEKEFFDKESINDTDYNDFKY